VSDDPVRPASPPDVLFCTDRFWERCGARVEAIAPGLEVVVLVGDERVAEEDLHRITVAFFSTDAWPERAAHFMSAALQAPHLRWLHSMSAGVDSPVFGRFLDQGAHLTTSAGCSATPIAGTVMMYLLALSRGLPRLLRAQAEHDWAWERWDELAGRRIAIVGWGPIGREVARLAEVFGMAPTIVRRAAHGDEPHPVRTLDDLVGVARDHDVVVVALPLTTDTRGIVDAEVLDALGPGGLFVNVGRGELVDQVALTAALVEGRLGGAGVDVTDPEPLPADDPLWDAPNLILTPHSSGSSDGTMRRADEAFLANLERWTAGEPLVNEVVR
jgi:phosphoglycerate dehydrogenase-like enzyme